MYCKNFWSDDILNLYTGHALQGDVDYSTLVQQDYTLDMLYKGVWITQP